MRSVVALALMLAAMAGPSWADDYKDCQSNGEMGTKIAACTRALEGLDKDPHRRAFALLHRGYAYRRNQDYDKALADIEEVLRLAPDNGRAYYERGLLRRRTEDYHNAVRDFDRAVYHLADKPFVWLARGRTNQLLGYDWQAKQDYDEAIRLDPDYALAHEYRAMAWCRLGRAEEALGDWDRMIAIDPERARKEQTWLKERGYWSGEIDGLQDDRLRDAARAYAGDGCPG